MAEKSKGLGGNPGTRAEGAVRPCDSLVEPEDVSDVGVDPPTFSSTIKNNSIINCQIFIFPSSSQ